MPGLTGGARGLRERFNFNTALALGAIALSLTLFVLIPYQVEQPPLLFGQAPGPLTPTFFPTVVAVCLLFVGILYLWASLQMRDRNGFRELTQHAYWNVGVTIAVLLLYASILKPFGFLLSSMLIVAVLSGFFGARHWAGILLVAIGAPIGVYIVFRYGLAVALPELPDF